MKIRLIDGWKKSYKFLSVQIGLIGAAVFGLIGAFPDAFLYAWNLIPDQLKEKIDEKWWPYVGASFMVLAVLARLINQPKATAAVEEAAEVRQARLAAEKELPPSLQGTAEKYPPYDGNTP